MADVSLSPVERRILELLHEDTTPDGTRARSVASIMEETGFTEGQVIQAMGVLRNLGFADTVPGDDPFP